MFARQINRVKLITGCQKTTGLRFMGRSDPTISEDKEEVAPKRLKQWRAHLDPGTQRLASKLKIFDRSDGRPPTDFIAQMNAPWDVSAKGVKNWWLRKRRSIEINDQRFVQERHEILGSNLAAAHFIVHRGGKVKFSGRSEWVVKSKDDNNYDLPTKYVPDYVIEAIDANGINLYYEGLANMQYLYELKFLSLKGCKTIDDWCLDRISSQYPRLEHLDVSNCVNVSERGLEALYRMSSLRVLIITNHYNSPAFDLTCMMLEDCIPDLRCIIKRGEMKESEKKVEAEKVESPT